MKKLQLENLGVQELNEKEMKETNGGLWFLGALLGGVIAWTIANFVKDVIIDGEPLDITEW